MKPISKIVTICFFLVGQTNYGLKIDRVILSTTVHPNYIEFWPLVARIWRDHLGIKPTLALISDTDIPINKTLGDVIQFHIIPGIGAGHQAQMIRMLLPILFENEVCLVADIDILPIDKSFFITQIQNISEDKFIIFNGLGYSKQNSIKNLTRIPMCYIAAKGRIFKEIFKIKSVENFTPTLLRWGENATHTSDEFILLRYLRSWEKLSTDCCFFPNCVNRFSGRRIFFLPYNKTKLTRGGYVDFHMHAAMPFSQHWQLLKEIVLGIGLKINFDEILEEIKMVIPFYPPES